MSMLKRLTYDIYLTFTVLLLKFCTLLYFQIIGQNKSVLLESFSPTVSSSFILVFDLALYGLLNLLLPKQRKRICIYYWCSPLLFTLWYIQGSLSLLPVLAIFLSIFLLSRGSYLISGFLWAFVNAFFRLTILATPFLLVYHIKSCSTFSQKFRYFAVYIFTLSAGFLLLSYPEINSQFLIQEFLLHPVHVNALITLFCSILVAHWSTLFFRTFYSKTSCLRDLTVSLIWTALFFPQPSLFAISFVLLTLLTVFDMRIPRSLYFGIQLVWILVHPMRVMMITQFHEIAIHSLFYGPCLAIIGYLIYLNIKDLTDPFLARPYLLGIAGVSGAGKTELAKSLEEFFGRRHTAVIDGDGSHRWQRYDKNWSKHTHFHPMSNELHSDQRHLQDISKGYSIRRKKYDHHTGVFTSKEKIYPKPLTIYQGLHSYFLPSKAELFDLKIYLEPDDQLRKEWKLKRDVEERGHSPNKVLDQIASREPDFLKYIKPQARVADLILRAKRAESDPISNQSAIVYDIELSSNYDLDRFIYCVEKYLHLDLRHDYQEIANQHLTLGKPINSEQAFLIAKKLKLNRAKILDKWPLENLSSMGLVLLLIAYIIQQEIKDDIG